MSRRVVFLLLALFSWPAYSHEDRALPIGQDGTLQGLPGKWGPVKVHIESGSSGFSEVLISSPRFKTKLNNCLIRLIPSPSSDYVHASASWYHDLRQLPPYVSLNFYSSSYDPKVLNNEGVTVVLSLEDGKVLMGFRTWDPWWGPKRGKRVEVPSQCSSWAFW